MESEGCKMEKCSTLHIEEMEVFHNIHRGCGSVSWYLSCLWRAWKCSKLTVEGVEVLHTARGGHGSAPHCPWRAWKCSKLPVELKAAQSISKRLEVA